MPDTNLQDQIVDTGQKSEGGDSGDSLAPKVTKWVSQWQLKRSEPVKPVMGRLRSNMIGGDPLTQKPLLRRAFRHVQNLVEESEEQDEQEATTTLGEAHPAQEQIEALERVIKEDDGAIKGEAEAFKGMDGPDMLAKLPSKDRDKRLKGIETALASVKDRRVRLRTALNDVTAVRVPLTEGMTKVYEKGERRWSDIERHLPDWTRHMRPGELDRRIETLMLTPEERQDKLKSHKEGFATRPIVEGENPQPIAQGELRGRLKGVIDKYSVQSFDDPGDYFKRFVLAPSMDDKGDLQEVAAVNDIIVDHCQEMLDCGGTLKDVEELLRKEDIPEVLWPPRLDAKVQAWRKTARAMQQQSLDEMSDLLGGGTTEPSTLQTVKKPVGTVEGIRSFIASNYSSVSEQIDKIAKTKTEQEQKAFANNLTTLGDYTDKLGTICDSLEGPMKLLSMALEDPEPVEREGIAKLQKQIDDGMSLLSSTLESVQGMLKAIDKFGPGLGDMIMKQVVPGLSLAKSGVDLLKSIKSLMEHSKALSDNRELTDVALEFEGSGDGDGGALLNVLLNDTGARKLQIGSDVTNVTTGILGTAGNAAGSFGGPHGQLAKTGLSIVSGVIKVGSMIVIGSINWSAAREARKILGQAQAGSPLAQQQVFKECAFYAKMYLVLLVQDDHPLAEKYLVNQGIRETDLSTSKSMRILAEAMMSASGQVKEEEVPENWLLAVTGSGGKTVVGIATGIRDKVKEVGKHRDVAYDDSWRASGVDLAEASYRSAKDAAIKAGLYDEETGIGKSLAKAAESLKAAGKVPPADPNKPLDPTTSPGKERQATLVGAVDALSDLVGSINGARPMTNPLGKDGQPSKDGKQKTHQGMFVYLDQLRGAATKRREELNAQLKQSGLKTLDIVFDTTTPLDVGKWRKNWQSGLAVACLPKEDAGVGAALESFASAQTDLGKVKDQSDGPARRKAVLAVATSFDKVAGALDDCRMVSGDAEHMSVYLTLIRSAAMQATSSTTKTISSESWQAKAIEKGKVTAPEWKGLWDKGVTGGFVDGSAGDGGVEKALQKMDAAKLSVEKAAGTGGKIKDPVGHLTAVKEYRKAVGTLVLGAQGFAKAQARAGAKPLNGSLANAILQGQELADGYGKALRDIRFATGGTGNAEGWEKTVANAVKAGAVADKNPAAKALGKDLRGFDTAFEAMQKARDKRDYKTALQQALKAQACVGAALTDIGQLLTVGSDYAANATMSRHITEVRKLTANAPESPPLSDVLAGNGAPSDAFKEPGGFLKELQGGINDAKKLGIIPDNTRGLETLSENYGSSWPGFIGAKKENRVAPEVLQRLQQLALRDAKDVMARLRELLGKSKNAAWQTYIKRLAAQTGKFAKEQLALPGG